MTATKKTRAPKSVNLMKGDCLTELKKLPDCSIDSIVTDPPYELTSGRPPVGFDHCLRGVFLEVQLPQLTNAVAKAPKFSKFDRELLDVVGLRRVVFGIDPRVGVPVGSVDFESNPVFEHEINNADVAAAITTDPDLSLVIDTKTVKNSGNFVLQLRDTGHSPFCQGSCGCVRQLAPGLLGVPVVIGGYALRDAFGLSAPSTDPSSLSDGIGCGDDSLGEASGTAFVVASPGAELGAVLAFDVARGAFDLFTADGAMKGDESFELLGPQLVGTLSGTSGLPTVFETTEVSQVVDPANWALSFDHLVLPARVSSFLGDNRSRGGFMGKTWDATGIAYSVEMWRECLRVLKPGGHLLAFSGSRTYHRMTVAIEDAGFEIRDQIAWISNKTFPKSLNVSKAIDKGMGENRQRQFRFTEWMRSTGITAKQIDEATGTKMGNHYTTHPTQPAIATADLFDLLRPLLPEVPEEIERLVAERTGIEWTAYKNRDVVGTRRQRGTPNGVAPFNTASSPVEELTAPATPEAQQWQGWGTALKPAHEPICVARKPLTGTVASNVLEWGTGALNIDGSRVGTTVETWPASRSYGGYPSAIAFTNTSGKVVRAQQTGPAPEGRWPANVIHDGSEEVLAGFPNEAARFFYCAKASKSERNAGLESNNHPTVKPLALMRYLVKLVTPPGGTVLDPFLGSGSTAVAAILEGFDWKGCEMTAEYWPIIEARVKWAKKEAAKPAQGMLPL